jgi:hypothetical protein
MINRGRFTGAADVLISMSLSPCFRGKNASKLG